MGDLLSNIEATAAKGSAPAIRATVAQRMRRVSSRAQNVPKGWTGRLCRRGSLPALGGGGRVRAALRA